MYYPPGLTQIMTLIRSFGVPHALNGRGWLEIGGWTTLGSRKRGTRRHADSRGMGGRCWMIAGQRDRLDAG